MQLRVREIAKFLSGIAFHETIGHWWLGIWGKDLLPWKFSWFTFTSTINTTPSRWSSGRSYSSQ